MAPAIRSVTEQVADGLRARIRDEGLEPGDRLGAEHELARAFGVSRPTMREALRLLSHGGLLRSTQGPGGGTFVARDGVDALRHSLAERIGAMLAVDAVAPAALVDARVALELPVARLAAERIDAAGIDALRGLIATDAPFHRALAAAAGNPVLQAGVDWAFDAVPAGRGDAAHAAIVGALAARDGAGAARALHAHLTARPPAAPAPHPAADGGASARVALALQAHIRRGGFVPGDRLGREDELAELLGARRSVLREALAVLVAGHLIRIGRGPGGGVFVANTFADGMGRMMSASVGSLLDAGLVTPAQLFEARMAIEPGLAADAARAARPGQLAALRAAIEAQAVARRDPVARTHAHVLFHRVVADMAPNRVIAAITAWIFDVLDPHLVRFEESDPDPAGALDQHEPILDAIAAGDAAATERLMGEHLRWLQSAVEVGDTAVHGPR